MRPFQPELELSEYSEVPETLHCREWRKPCSICPSSLLIDHLPEPCLEKVLIDRS